MKLDSEEQRNTILELIGKVPIQANIDTLFAGPGDDIKALVQAIQAAEIEEVKEA